MDTARRGKKRTLMKFLNMSHKKTSTVKVEVFAIR